jgi:cysteine desulfuration protein SufE
MVQVDMEKKTLADFSAELQTIADELNELAAFDTMEMYRHLSECGDQLAQAREPAKIPANFVPGCTSNVYIDAHLENGVLVYTGSSEALVVRGYVAILVHALSGLSPADILSGTQTAVDQFATSTNIRATLTPSRANAFGNIYRMMVDKARALVPVDS